MYRTSVRVSRNSSSEGGDEGLAALECRRPRVTGPHPIRRARCASRQKLLDQETIDVALTGLDGWSLKDGKLHKTYLAAEFERAAMGE